MVPLTDPDPKAFDCAELSEWGLAQVGVPFVDGSANQCRKARTISVATALKLPGALLFREKSGQVYHVAVSLGNGYVVEAKGKRYGVVISKADSGYSKAGKVPALYGDAA